MNKPKFTFNASADKVGQILIDGTIGDSWWEETINTFKKISSIIDEVKASGCTSYHVKIHSLGGDVDHALAIYSLLKGLPNVTTEIVGMCASAATIIFMAGSSRVMDSSALMLIHHAWTAARGNAQQIERTVETLRTIDDTLVGIYTQASGLSAQEVNELMDACDGDGKWISASECKQKNLCTLVTEAPKAQTQQQFFALADIKHHQLPIPEQMEELSPSTWAKIKNLISSLSTPKTQPMKKNIVAAYALLAAIFSELMADENGNVTLSQDDLKKIENQLSSSSQSAADLDKKVKALEQSLSAANADKDKAVSDLSAANAKIAELQALLDKTPKDQKPVNGKDQASNSAFDEYWANSQAYAQAEAELKNY